MTGAIVIIPGPSPYAKFVNVQNLLPTNRFWDQNETAYYLDLKPPTLKKWRALGKGPPFRKLGGRIRYSPADVKQWAAQQKRVRG